MIVGMDSRLGGGGDGGGEITIGGGDGVMEVWEEEYLVVGLSGGPWF